MPLVISAKKEPDTERFSQAMVPQCSRFAPSAHSWPENLLALRFWLILGETGYLPD
jgi:hypothetical protein